MKDKFDQLDGVSGLDNDGETQRALLRRLADIADPRQYPRLSRAREDALVRDWVEKSDEKALERLLIDKSRLIIKEQYPTYRKFQKHVTLNDVLDFALVGVRKGGKMCGVLNGIEAYHKRPLAQKDTTLNTYVTNGAEWGVNMGMKGVLPQLFKNGYMFKILKAIENAEIERGSALSKREEDDIASSFSPSMRHKFHSRLLGGTIRSSKIYATKKKRRDNPRYDADADSRFEDADPMALFIDPNAEDPLVAAEQEQLAEKAWDALELLSEREKLTLCRRFNVQPGTHQHPTPWGSDDGACNLEQTARYLGVLEYRAGAIEATELRRLRHPSRSDILRSALFGEEDFAKRREEAERLKEQNVGLRSEKIAWLKAVKEEFLYGTINQYRAGELRKTLIDYGLWKGGMVYDPV